MDKIYDVCAIENALVDLLLHVTDEELVEHNLAKGRMHLWEHDKSHELLEKLHHKLSQTMPGGGAANTIAALAQLGANTFFCGKVGKDHHGSLYDKELQRIGVKTHITTTDTTTGHALTLITPDGERTFVVHLGASILLRKEDIPQEVITKSTILHLTAYQLEDPALREMLLHAMSVAKKHGTLISLDLADASLVKRNKELLESVLKEFVDIVFANEQEAFAFTDSQPHEALNQLGQHCTIAVVKLGAEGSLIKKDDTVIHIPVERITPIDTTGAGDLYAAGFLYGYIRDWDIEKCGHLGSKLGKEIITIHGARLPTLDKNSFIQNS